MRSILAAFVFALALTPQDVPLDLQQLTMHSRDSYLVTADWPCWSQGFTWRMNKKSITVRREERATVGDTWQRSENEYTTSFALSAVCARDGGDDLFVAGLASNGDVVIERWTFPERSGRWHHVPPVASTIGNSMPAYSGTVEVKGGTFTAPPARHASPSRTALLQSSTFSCVRSMAADPEGRFLLFQNHANGFLYCIRLDQATPGAPTLAFDTSGIADVAKTFWINTVEFIATGKRLWVLLEPKKDGVPAADLRRVLLWDNDNDGQFDSNVSMSFLDYRPLFGVDGKCRAPWIR